MTLPPKIKIMLSGLLLSLFFTSPSSATTPISLFSTKQQTLIPTEKINLLVKKYFDIEQYRTIKVQVMQDTKNHTSAYLLVYLFSKQFHSVKVAKISLDANYHGTSMTPNYQLTAQDFAEQPGPTVSEAKCPDPTVQVIAFAPNDIVLEQNKTIEVAKAAKTHHLKTIKLLKEKATSANYLNYMACPQLEGNFYDGDASPTLITTYDGVISSDDISRLLKNHFKFKVINIWLACEGYNDPLKSTMIDIAQSQKYAAGINNLRVGPSDNAAACAMEAAFDGKPMKASFNECVDELDKNADGYVDHWGFDGNGTDYFAT